MLDDNRDDNPTATVVTTSHGDDAILECLNRYGFQFTHRGFVQNKKGIWDQYDYWSATWSGRTIAFGLRTLDKPALEHHLIPISLGPAYYKTQLKKNYF